MKKKDIERMLKTEIEQNTPDVLSKILSTPVEVEKVKQTNTQPQKNNAPYFQFRYLYVAFALCAVLVIGLGFLTPNVQDGGILGNYQEHANYNVNCGLTVNDVKISFVYNTSNSISSYKVTKGGVTTNVELSAVATLDNALDYAISVLGEDLADATKLTLHVTASVNKYTDQNFNQIKSMLVEKLQDQGYTNIQIVK